MNNEHEICRIFARIFCDNIGDLPYWYFEMETQLKSFQAHATLLLTPVLLYDFRRSPADVKNTFEKYCKAQIIIFIWK